MMNNALKFTLQLLLFVFILITSCKGQKKSDLPQDRISQAKPSQSTLPDVDPYFTESKGITKSYGPNSITRNILQDKKGDIWLATWEGIIHYDGKVFTNFTNKEGLRRFHVFCILEDRAGDIWFGTIGAGVYHYDGKSFTNITTQEGLVNNYVTCIYEDKKGTIWFGTTGGLSRYDGNTFTNITTADGLSNNDVNSIIEDRNGKFWFGTRGDACTYDGNTFTKLTPFTNFINKEGSSFENVRSIIEDKKGNIWLGGNDGLWRYDGDTFTNHALNFVGYIYEDKKGNIWTSSAAIGNPNNWILSRYDEKIIATQVKAEANMFFGIMEDQEGGIWLGSLYGAYRYDGNTFDDFKKPTPLSSDKPSPK